jgi:hypothetical protein
MIYCYIKQSSPNLNNLEISILSSIISKSYSYLRWDKEDSQLKVYLNRELTSEEKKILDTIIG